MIDLAGQIVLPGFVNAHHHLSQTLRRNLAAAQNNNLFPCLQAQHRIWAGTTEKASGASTLIGHGSSDVIPPSQPDSNEWTIVLNLRPQDEPTGLGLLATPLRH